METLETKELSAQETGGAAFVVLSRFTVANGLEAEVKEAFRNRPHRVDGAPGFLRLEVLTPTDDPREIWLLTWWRDRASFEVWHRDHLRESHQDIPRGLKLVSQSTQIRYFEPVAT